MAYGRHGITPTLPVAVQMGLWPGYRIVNKFGTNLEVGTGREDVWAAGGTRTPILSPQTLEITSDDAGGDDVPTGDGARSVTIYGLDENFNERILTYDMSATPLGTVTTAESWWRVYRAHVNEAGATGVNVGNITIAESGGSTTQGYILAGVGQTQQSHYTVPANTTAILISKAVSTSSDRTSAQVRFWQRHNVDNASPPFTPKRVWSRVDAPGSPFVREMAGSISFPEKTDIWATATASGASNLPVVNVEYMLLLVPGSQQQDSV